MKLNKIRKDLQKCNNLTIKEISREMNISERSVYRSENIRNFEKSIFIRFLNFLRKNQVDANQVLKEIFDKTHTKQ